MTAYDRIVSLLRDDGRKVTHPREGEARAKCPAHNGESDNSLAVKRTSDRALLHCHGGCDVSEVLDALNLTKRDLYDNPRTEYHYTDPLGTVVRTVSRTYDKAGKKTFRQAGDTKRNILFQLPQVLEAVKAGRTVYLVEGEADVVALEELAGVVATTAPQGASNVHLCDLSPLHGADVVAVVDKDEAGRTWAAKVKAALDGKAKSLTFTEAKVGKDAADHLAADLGVDDLVPLDEETDLPLRRARITWATDIEPEPVVWAWEEGDRGRIPSGSLSIAAGREGTGKSSFGIWLAAKITRGELPGKFHGTPRRVFYIAVEDSWKYTLVPRLMAAGADLSMVGRFDVVTIDEEEVTLSLPADNKLLEREVAHHNVALVVLDPLMSVVSDRLDTHRTREVRVALDPLAKMADRTGAIFLGIAHFNKASGTDAASLLSGSHAFRDVPRTIFGFARDDSDESGGRVMTQVKNSLGRDDLPSLSYVIEGTDVFTPKGTTSTGKFVFTGESERSVAEILRESRYDPEDVEERRDAATWISGYLSDCGGQAPAKDVLAAGKAVGYSEQTLKNARRKVADTDRTGFGREQVHTWILRTGTPTGTAGTTNERPVPAVPVPVPVAESPHSSIYPPCEVCGADLWAPQSQTLGICARCVDNARESA